MEELGFDWTLKVRSDPNGKKITKWEARFNELMEFKERHGHVNVPTKTDEFPILGPWLKRQKKIAREGTMRKDKYDRLKDIGFDFGGPKVKKVPWETMYAALVGKRCVAKYLYA